MTVPATSLVPPPPRWRWGFGVIGLRVPAEHRAWVAHHLRSDAAVRRTALLRLQMTAVVEPEDVARAALDKVEQGGGHVVLPRRMTPIMAMAWAPRRAAELVLSGVPRR